MATMMFIIGAVLATNPPDSNTTSVSSASIAMVAMIYLYVIGYSASWGPTPWVYLGEVGFIFSVDILTRRARLTSHISFRFFQLVYVPMVSVLVQPRNGSSALSSPKSLLMLSMKSAGECF